MAAVTLGALKLAEFKTAYLQREIPLDVVVADGGLKVGALVKLSVGNSGPVIGRAASLADATHLVAQSDMTVIPEDHPKTEYRNYQYSDAVKGSDPIFANTNFIGVFATTGDRPAASDNANKYCYVLADNTVYKASSGSWAAESSAGTSGVVTATKHVALYPLVEKTDVVVRA